MASNNNNSNNAAKRIQIIGNHLIQKDIVFETKPNGTQLITLTRPDQLNALNQNMINSLGEWLTEWANDSKVSVVIIRGQGKAFCAGGDIRALAMAAQAKDASVPRLFFGPEFILVHQIFKYPKPYIALLDGITMGGGVGISIGAKFRIASEKLLFAMPETGIGFVTDVGSGHFLSRLKKIKGVGMFIGLTGARINAADAVFTGIASHFVKSENINSLVDTLTSLQDPSVKNITDVVNKFNGSPGESSLAKVAPLIEHCFGASTSMEDVMQRLDSVINSEVTISGVASDKAVEWAKTTKKTLLSRSPLSLKVVYELIDQGKNWDIKTSLEVEYRIAMRMVVNSPSFYEGVRAVIIDKDNKPKWKPSTLSEVTEVTSFFKKFSLEEQQSLSPELFS